jgi:hypothetical protein
VEQADAGLRHRAGRMQVCDLARRRQAGEDGGKAGEQHARLGTERLQRLRQRAGDVGQAAGLEQRKDFGADLKDSHRRSSLNQGCWRR